MAKYKIGDKFHRGESYSEEAPVVHEIIGVYETDECTVYWVKGNDPARNCGESLVDLWTKIEPSFEIGKSYRFSDTRDAVYHVEATRTLSNGERYAWSEKTCSYATAKMVTLSHPDFEQMEECRVS